MTPLVADIYYSILRRIGEGRGQPVDPTGAAIQAGSKNPYQAFLRMKNRGWIKVSARAGSNNRGIVKPKALYTLTERGVIALRYGAAERTEATGK
jgi:DNA-binding PadR family transcriptional regulator